VPYDTSKFVEISINEVVKTLAEAMVLAVSGDLSVPRQPAPPPSFPPSSVPIALIGGLVGLYVLGYSIPH